MGGSLPHPERPHGGSLPERCKFDDLPHTTERMAKRTRKNDRIDCAIHGKVLGRHGYAAGTVHNLSNGGLYFAGKRLTVEKQTEMSFDLEGKKIQAVVEVLYRKVHGEDAGIGVRFIRLSAGAAEWIARYAAGPLSDAEGPPKD